MADGQTDIARAVQEVSERASLLIREEIELAKAEITTKITKLAKGAVFGIVAGVFAVFSLIYLLHSLSWAIWDILEVGDSPWIGFLITGVLILILGGICAFIALRMIKRGSPPTPQLAIEEAQLIKGTLTASPPARTTGGVAARQAPAPAPQETKR